MPRARSTYVTYVRGNAAVEEAFSDLGGRVSEVGVELRIPRHEVGSDQTRGADVAMKGAIPVVIDFAVGNDYQRIISVPVHVKRGAGRRKVCMCYLQ